MTDNNSDSANRRIISRMQQRRGLKQDIPQPLRPGELGFAIDSRQVYIGGDPNDPNAAQYRSVSYFENTTGAIEHTLSITENQIIAFTVPFIRFDRSTLERREFQWKADFARSTAESAQCFHSGRDKPVFRIGDIEVIETQVNETSTTRTMWVDAIPGNPDPAGSIRVGDRIDGVEAFDNPDDPVIIDTVTPEGGRIRLRVDRVVRADQGEPVQIIPASLINYRTGRRFVSEDVVVSRNGIRLNADTDPDNVIRPGPAFDFALNANNVLGDEVHELALRTRTTVRDQISLCYYPQSAVRQAFNGVPRPNDPQGRSFISGSSNIESFYSRYDIPEYRKIDDENIRLSTTSGLGFIGLQQKHIVTVADGERISNPDSLSLGTLLISRDDFSYETDLVEPESDPQDWTITFSDLASENNPFSTTATNLTRAYNRVRLFVPSDSGNPLDGVVADVIGVSEELQRIQIRLPSDVDGASIAQADPTGFAELVEVNPILAFNLSDVTTLSEAIAIINQSDVEFKLNRRARNLFPLVEYTPNPVSDEPERDRIFLTQNPSFSSVASGGLNFRLYEDSAGTLATLGLTAGHYTRATSVRAKLEEWLRDLVQTRDCNLFTSILPASSITYNPSVSFPEQYNVQLDATFGEVTFCTREEAANFNFLINKAYTEALFDRARDTNDGVRGLINLRNNVEIQTREGAVVGERITTFIDMERAIISEIPGANEVVFTLPADVYNVYQIEYSITEASNNPSTRYSRVGQLMVIGRTDFDSENLSDAAVLNDQFSSHWEDVGVENSTRTIVEPQFRAQMTADGNIQIRLKTQTVENSSGNTAQVIHNVGEELTMRYIIKRWNSNQ